MATTTTKRITAVASGGQTKRVTETPQPSELALEGDAGHGNLLLEGDMANGQDFNLLLEGDMQSRALSAILTRRVTL